MAEIYYLHGKPRPIEQFTRIGCNEHRQLGTLHASGLYKILPETTRSAPPAWRGGHGSDRAQDGR